MRVFFVGEFSIYAELEKEKELRSWGVKDRLISYAFLRADKKPYKLVFSSLIKEKVYDGVMIDSGAYSVSTKGLKISWEEYTEFCKTFGADFYLSLDVIPKIANMQQADSSFFEHSATETVKNYEFMRKEGANVIPTFHKGERFYFLEKMVNEFPFIALSMTSQRLAKPEDNMRFLNECFTLIDKIAPKTKVHGLSVTDLILPIKFPWYSVDSAAWVKHAYSGTIKIIIRDHWGKDQHKFTTLAVTDRSKERIHYKYTDDMGGIVSKKYVDLVEEYLNSIGSSLDKCRTSMEERLKVNVKYYNYVLFRNKEPYKEEVRTLI